MKKLLLFFLLIESLSFAQSFRLMTYNLLNYPGNDTIVRNPHFRTILSEVHPDILVVQEIQSQTGVDGFLNNVLNNFGYYSAGSFIDGPDTDNAIFFRDSLFDFISNTPVKTALRDINEFRILIESSLDTLIIYSAHLKASSGSSNEVLRAAEVDSLRKVTDKLSASANYFVVGDFNLYTSNESAYQKLLNNSQSGYFLDPIDRPGNWNNNSSFASIHTQSPRIRQFGGGSTGGMDDRFDFILISQAIKDPAGISYIDNSYKAYGNDGNHFNDSINRQPNNAVPVSVANALHYASDHLPVYSDFSFEAVIPVELISFSASYENDHVFLSWSTATETNNYGFEVQVSQDQRNWQTLGLIRSSGSSTSNNTYSFSTKNFSDNNFYRLKILDLDGSFTYSYIVSINVPLDFELYQNYPNPFNPVTTIKYSLKSREYIILKVVDSLGRNISTLISGEQDPGLYEVYFNASDLASGFYYYSLEAGGKNIVKKLILQK